MIPSARLRSPLKILAVVLVISSLTVGVVGGQLLEEVTYYQQDFTEYEDQAFTGGVSDVPLDITTDADWSRNSKKELGTETPDFIYGPAADHRFSGYGEPNADFLSREGKTWNSAVSYVGLNRTLKVPEGMTNPKLVIEHGWKTEGTNTVELAVDGQTLTTEDTAGSIISEPSSFGYNYQEVGSLPKESEHFQRSEFIVPSGNDTVQLQYVMKDGQANTRNWLQLSIHDLRWEGAGPTNMSSEIDGFSTVNETMYIINESGPAGDEVHLSNSGTNITREFNISGIDSKPERVYVQLDGEASSGNVDWYIEQQGEKLATGSIGAGTSTTSTKEVDFRDEEFKLVINSAYPYEVNAVTITGLEETTAGDPLSSNIPFELDAEGGYDQTVGMFTGLLDITTTTLMYIFLTALAIGGVVYSYTRSVRSQEFGQSLVAGALVMGVVMVGLVPTLNAATWLFTGDTARAPLANPALEAEPPTYYSTEFQAGTMAGWEAMGGQPRLVTAGDGFNLQMTGQTPMAKRDVHISLGDSLDTGFVRLKAKAQSQEGYTGPVHQTNVRVRVYVTDGAEPERVSSDVDLTEEDLSEYSDVVSAQEFARSYDGQLVSEEGTITFPLEGNTVFVEVVGDSNRDDVQATLVIESIAVGATTGGTGEIH